MNITKYYTTVRIKLLSIFIGTMFCMVGVCSSIYAQPKEVVIEGVLKMHYLNSEGDCNVISQYRNTDGVNTYLAFVMHFDKKMNVLPYLDEGDRELLGNLPQSSIMIVPHINYSSKEFAAKYANRRVCAKGTLYVPGAGWRNATAVVMNLKGITLMPQNSYVDLGLPSGTLWNSKNESGFYDYEQAMNKFGSKMPTKGQWEELKRCCTWTWIGKGYRITGMNGNSIVLPAEGFLDCAGGRGNVGYDGGYWSCSSNGASSYGDEAWNLIFNGKKRLELIPDYECTRQSVRLVKRK